MSRFSLCSLASRSFASEAAIHRPRRAILYVPGNDERKIRKSIGLDVDAVVLDCEDGVAMNRKVKLLLINGISLFVFLIIPHFN